MPLTRGKLVLGPGKLHHGARGAFKPRFKNEVLLCMVIDTCGLISFLGSEGPLTSPLPALLYLNKYSYGNILLTIRGLACKEMMKWRGLN